MIARILRLATLKQLLKKFSALLVEARDVRYVSVPVWRPWRNF